MAYATVSDVLARTAYRGTYSNTTTPTASQVIGYIFDAAAQLDQWLYAAGYNAPFDTLIASGMVATTAQFLLKRWNVTGAALLVEETSPSSDRRKDFQELWQQTEDAIKDRENDLPLPVSGAKLYPRGPGAPGSSASVVAQGIGAVDISPRIGSLQIGHWDL